MATAVNVSSANSFSLSHEFGFDKGLELVCLSASPLSPSPTRLSSTVWLGRQKKKYLVGLLHEPCRPIAYDFFLLFGDMDPPDHSSVSHTHAVVY